MSFTQTLCVQTTTLVCYHSARFKTHTETDFFSKQVKLFVACPALFCSQHPVNFKIFKRIFLNAKLHCVKHDSIRAKTKKRGHLGEVTGKFSCLEERVKKRRNPGHHLTTLQAQNRQAASQQITRGSYSIL